jgi:hypothetical protein
MATLFLSTVLLTLDDEKKKRNITVEGGKLESACFEKERNILKQKGSCSSSYGYSLQGPRVANGV